MNKPPASALLLIVAGLTTAVFGLRDQNAAADPPSSAPLPDIIGIQMGMPMNQAVAILKAYNAAFQFSFSFTSEGPGLDNGRGNNVVSAEWKGMKDGKSAYESFNLGGTWAPPHNIYRIARKIAGQLDTGGFVAAMRKKHGPEYFHSNGFDQYTWPFDRQGRSVATDKQCDANGPEACQAIRLVVGWPSGYGFQETLTDDVVTRQEGQDSGRRRSELAQKARDEAKRQQTVPKL